MAKKEIAKTNKKVFRKKPLTEAQMKAVTDKYEAELLKIIKEKEIMFFDHCFAYVSFSRATAYNHALDKMDSIKSAIANNKVSAKNYMLAKWVKSDNPTLQIAAFRLVSEIEEHKKLNQAYVDHTTGGKKLDYKFEIVKPSEN